MRTKLAPGAEIETATQEEVAKIIGAEFDRRPSIDYTRRKDVVTLDANGTNVSNPIACHISAQYDWRIERVTLGGSGAPNAIVRFYENAIASDADLLEVVQVGAAGWYSDSFSNDLYLPANSTLMLAVAGGVANGQLTYNLQIRQIRRVQGLRGDQ